VRDYSNIFEKEWQHGWNELEINELKKQQGDRLAI